MIYEPSNVSPSFSAVDLYTHGNNPVRKPLPITFVVHTDTNSPITSATVNIYSSEGVEYSNLSISGITYPLYEGNIVNGGVSIDSTSMDNGRSYSFSITLKTSNPNIFIANGILENAISGGAMTIVLPTGVVAANLMNDNDNYIQIGTELLKIKSADDTTNTITLNSAVQNSYNKGTTYTLYTNQFTSAQYYFTTAWNPEVTIYGVTAHTVTQKSYTCHALYSTNINNLSYNYYEWSIYSGGNLLDTYRSSTPVEGSIGEHAYYNFAWEIDGLISGNEYTVGLYVEWQNGMTSQANPITFAVQYKMGDLDIPIQYDLLCDQSGIQVSWQHDKLVQSNGVISGNVGTGYQYVLDEPWQGNSSVLLAKPSQLSYTMIDAKGYPISFPHVQNTDEGNDGSYFFHVKLSPDMQAGTIIKIEATSIQIIDLTNTTPTSGMSEGSFYVNTGDNRLYQYTNNTWDKIGVPLNVGDIYKLGTSFYTFDGDEIIPITTNERPFIEIKWDGIDKFVWDIHRVTESSADRISGEYQIPAPMAAWLLQPQNADKSLKYQWDDTKAWNDDLYWTEQDSSNSFFSRTWFKVNIFSRAISFKMMYDSEYEEPKYHLFYYLGNETTTWDTGVSAVGVSTQKTKDYLSLSVRVERATMLQQHYAYITGGTPYDGLDLSEYGGIGMITTYDSPDPRNYIEQMGESVQDSNTLYHFNDLLLLVEPNQQPYQYTQLIGVDPNTRKGERAFKWVENKDGLLGTQNWLQVTCGAITQYADDDLPPLDYNHTYAVFGTKPDNWQFLCYFVGLTPPSTIKQLIANATWMQLIFNDYSAVQYMYKVCTGDFMAQVLSNKNAYQWLKESPYYQEVATSQHWGLFISLMENEEPCPTPFPTEMEIIGNSDSNNVVAYRNGYTEFDSIIKHGGTVTYQGASQFIGSILRTRDAVDLSTISGIEFDLTIEEGTHIALQFLASRVPIISTNSNNQPSLIWRRLMPTINPPYPKTSHQRLFLPSSAQGIGYIGYCINAGASTTANNKVRISNLNIIYKEK